MFAGRFHFPSPKQQTKRNPMAIVLEASYSKKLGLPGYSSHQFSVTIKTEVSDPTQVQNESTRLYGLLQTCVDREIQNPGFLPEAAPRPNRGGNGHTNGNGNGHDRWGCSDKQRDLILRLTDEHKLDKVVVDQLAQARFGKGVRQLNKLEASGLIEELFEQTGQPGGGRRFQNGTPQPARS
jgi:hypothetical protein